MFNVIVLSLSTLKLISILTSSFGYGITLDNSFGALH